MALRLIRTRISIFTSFMDELDVMVSHPHQTNVQSGSNVHKGRYYASHSIHLINAQQLGQWAASRTDLFSPDLCHILGRLHSAAHPHSIRHTRRVLATTYSDAESLDDIFEEFDDKPIGCGAIAQVYKGKLREQFIPDDWRIANRHEDDSWIVTFITNVLNNYQNQQDTTQELITSSRHVAVKVIHRA